MEQRTRIIELYREKRCQISLTQKPFEKQYNLTKASYYETIKGIVDKFTRFGNIAYLSRCDRLRTSRTDENKELARQNVFENKNASIRKQARKLCLNNETLRIIMTKDLQLKPYKVKLVYKIQTSDTFGRISFSSNFEHLVSQNENFIDKLIMSNKAHFF
uniref:DUF4817 domain-containing protein n=1 Tax=Strongyloides stercoralis TaxID=6248 RepID=A0A0K0EH25_STRER